MDWNLHNAQQDLQRRQPRNGVRPIGQIKYAPGTVADYGIETAVDAPVRHFHLTPLSDFRYDHLQPQQRGVLGRAVQKAQSWLDCYARQPGLSMVLCGPVGVGKTTIAENLMKAFERVVRVELTEDDKFHLERIQTAIDGLPPNSDMLPKLQQALADCVPPTVNRILNGRIFDATELMRIVGDQQPLGFVLANDQVIVVDDVGTEDFSTPTYTPSAESVQPVRHNRYGRFLEYCYKAGKHVIITSNVPLVAGEEVNPAFIDIFGSKGYSRLLQMAGGYMVDLSGLPDYRPYLAGLLK